MGVKNRRQWVGGSMPRAVGYCPNVECGVPIHIVRYSNGSIEPRGFISGDPYRCKVCQHEWIQE